MAQPRPRQLERGEGVLETLERQRPFADGKIENQFCYPDRPIVSCLHQARDDDAVEEYVITSGGEADELVGQGRAPSTKRTRPALPSQLDSKQLTKGSTSRGEPGALIK